MLLCLICYRDNDPHALIVLLGGGPGSQCLHVWRDEAPAAALQAGDLKIFVHHEHLGHVRKLLQWLYPPGKAPPVIPPGAGVAAPAPPARPVMEIYSPPQADIRWEVQRDFYIRTGGNSSGAAPDPD